MQFPFRESQAPTDTFEEGGHAPCTFHATTSGGRRNDLPKYLGGTSLAKASQNTLSVVRPRMRSTHIIPMHLHCFGRFVGGVNLTSIDDWLFSAARRVKS